MKSARFPVLGGLVVLVGLVAVACASTSTTTEPKTEPAPATPAPEVDAAVDAAKTEKPDAGPKEDAEAPAAECTDSANQNDCITCCSTAHEDGAGTYYIALSDCVCDPAQCQTECAATFCSDQNPDKACSDCIKAKTNTCAKAVQQACGNDPDCVLFTQCADKASCASKP